MKKQSWVKGYKKLRSKGLSHRKARYSMNRLSMRSGGIKRRIRSRTRASRSRSAYSTAINW